MEFAIAGAGNTGSHAASSVAVVLRSTGIVRVVGIDFRCGIDGRVLRPEAVVSVGRSSGGANRWLCSRRAQRRMFYDGERDAARGEKPRRRSAHARQAGGHQQDGMIEPLPTTASVSFFLP